VFRRWPRIAATLRSKNAAVSSVALAWHDPRMEQGRGTTGFDDSMVENVIALRLRQRRVGHLVHADGARSRLVDRERIRGQTPPPIGPRNGIAGALDLGERGEQLRRDRGGGIFSKERRILSPGFIALLRAGTRTRPEAA
jgi:hypothetical protein